MTFKGINQCFLVCFNSCTLYIVNKIFLLNDDVNELRAFPISTLLIRDLFNIKFCPWDGEKRSESTAHKNQLSFLDVVF